MTTAACCCNGISCWSIPPIVAPVDFSRREFVHAIVTIGVFGARVLTGWHAAGQHLTEAIQHAGCCTPDVAALIRDREVMAMPPLEPIVAPLVAAVIEEMRERGLEHR